MKVFLINLDHDSARLAEASRQLSALKVPFSRVSAVYAKTLPKSEKMRHVNRFRWWCAMGRMPRDGEIGCALSHANIYRRIVDEGMNLACVLEDDVVLDARFSSVLSYVEANDDPDKPAVYLLSNHADPQGQGGNDFTGFTSPPDAKFEMRRTYWDLFTEGYVVNRRGAAALLRANYPLITPCDQWMRWAGLGFIRLYHVMPTVCGQNKSGFASTTAEGAVIVDKMSFLRKMTHKALHAVGLYVDRCLIKLRKK